MTVSTTASQPGIKTHDPEGKLDEQEDFGLCVLVVDSAHKGAEVVCGMAGVDEVLIRNPFGLYVAVLCREHKDQHRRFYDRLHARQNRPRRSSHTS